MSEKHRWLVWLVVPVVAVGVMGFTLLSGRQAPVDSEARAYNLEVSLKCPICAGESLAGSQTDLAKDLRARINEEIAAGRTDREIIDEFVAAYGEQVLLDPPNSGWGIALWALPLALLAGGLVTIFGLRRRRAEAGEEP